MDELRALILEGLSDPLEAIKLALLGGPEAQMYLAELTGGDDRFYFFREVASYPWLTWLRESDHLKKWKGDAVVFLADWLQDPHRFVYSVDIAGKSLCNFSLDEHLGVTYAFTIQ